MSTVTKFEEKTLAIHRIRVNVKSLAAEAQFIRREADRAGFMYRSYLTEHRRGKLREEARYAQLALAFVRGRKYQTCELKAREAPEAVRLHRKLERFLFKVSPKDVADWLAA